jgi:hypothetical protein
MAVANILGRIALMNMRNELRWSVVLAGLAAAATMCACGGQAIEAPNDGPGGAAGSGGTTGTGATGGTGGSPETGGAPGTGGTPNTGGTGGMPNTGGTGGSTIDGGLQPPGPPDAGPGGGPGVSLAFSRIYLGDTTYEGVPSPTAWEDYGYDIDGVISSASTPGHCQLAEGASPAQVLTDGNDGIDNSFGANIIPVIVGLASDAGAQINELLSEGAFTFILDIHGMGSDPNYGLLETAFLVGANHGTPPAWDGQDVWPLACEGLVTCLPSGTPDLLPNESKYYLTESYVTNGVYVSGNRGDIDLVTALNTDGLLLFLPSKIHHTVLTAQLNPGSPTPTSATHGVLSGVLDTEEYLADLRKKAGLISSSLCQGPTWDSVAQQIRSSSDIMKDGTQDPGMTCDGISIGLGFDAVAVRVGDVRDQQPVQPDPCLDY